MKRTPAQAQFWLLFILVGGLLAISPWPGRAQVALPELSIGKTGDEIKVQWPSDAAGFRLQSIKAFDPLNFWENVTGEISAEGGINSYLEEAKEASRFFRLFKSDGGKPELGSLTLSATEVDVDHEVVLSFHFSNPGDVFTYLSVTRSNWTGVVTERLAAGALG